VGAKKFFSGAVEVLGKIAFVILVLFVLGLYAAFATPIAALIVGIVAACSWVVAKNKGRDEYWWFFITAIFPPLILILLCMSKITYAPASKPEPQRETQKCHFCAEDILSEAIVCKHCGRDLLQPEPPAATSQ